MVTSTEPTPLYKADTIDVIAVAYLLWRHKYFVAIVGFAFAVAAAVWALAATPIYRAEAVVVPAREDGVNNSTSLASRFGGLASLAGINLGNGGGDAASNSMAVLRSRRLIEEFIKRNALAPVLFPVAGAPPSLGFAVDRFRQTVVSIVTDKERGTTVIAVNWTDPKVAATWANELVATANDLIRSRALEDSSRNIEYLNRQLDQTNVVELRRVLYSLVEAETQKTMLANARSEYAFTVVDPAVAPESRVSPKRTLMVLTAAILGLFVAVMTVLIHNAIGRFRVADTPTNVDMTRKG
jgi:uncharacterized protein involved in exopolysaccharide biosynthesis